MSNRIINNIMTKFVFGFLMCVSLESFAADFYVSTNGLDDNNGTLDRPWRNVSKALVTVAADAGHAVHLGPGTFTETNILLIPSGVSLIGSGSSQTAITVNHFYSITNYNQWTSATYHPEQFVIQLNGSNQTLRGFSLDGQARKAVGGIYAQHAVNVVFDDLNIQNFRVSAIFLDEGFNNAEIKNCFIKNNAMADTKTGDTGNILFQFGKNLSIHDNHIEEQGAIKPDLGGYGIKRAQCCGWDYENSHYHENLKIFNNTIIVPSVGGWENGLAPAITIECCGGLMKNCEIYNNDLNNHVSLVGNFNFHAYSGKSVRVHHNYFNLGHGRYAYAVEANVPGLEIDHNIFNGGLNPIAQWDDRRTDNTFYDHVIHHNVWYDQWADQALVHYNKAPIGGKGFQFYNNTLIDNNGIKMIFAVGGFNNADIRNNLFNSTKGKRGNIFGSNPAGTLTNNLFFNISERGTNQLVADPLLTLAGASPSPFFQLKPGSQAKLEAATPRTVIVRSLHRGQFHQLDFKLRFVGKAFSQRQQVTDKLVA